jgi:2-phospho-L-lactate transferase/gluconeogenesis factor (CofD/UPF0052 family)/FMN phosphatase YigB (HAD superfamily)
MLALVGGQHRALYGLRAEDQIEILEVLKAGWNRLPQSFPLADACIGNILLIGATIRGGTLIDAIDWARSLLGVSSRVLPVTLTSAHLGAQLDTGDRLLGQASLTANEALLRRRIRQLVFLAAEDSWALQVRPKACPQVVGSLCEADVIVFGFGSFYTSILPQLLVDGVSEAIRQSSAATLFLCNPFADKETESLTATALVQIVRSVVGDEMRRVPSHVIYFEGTPGLSIPIGDRELISREGCHLRIESQALTYEDIAQNAAEAIASLAGAESRRNEGLLHDGYPVVLFDLDHTLFDYSQLRRTASVAGLTGVCGEPQSIADLLLRELTTPTTDVLVELGLPDLRREWNAKAFFALGMLCDQSTLRGDVIGMFESLRSLLPYALTSYSFEVRRRLRAIALQLRDLPSTKRVLLEIQRVGQQADLTEAVIRFDEHVKRNGTVIEGVREALEQLRTAGASICIVTEGTSVIQRAKIASLNLSELVDAVVVTDRTLGVLPLIEALVERWVETVEPPGYVARLYDNLFPYTVKATPFYGKLVHGLVRGGPAMLTREIESTVFVSMSEWDGFKKPRVAMVGDSYRRDVEPLLTACPRGAVALRVLSGKYSSEDPLHEVIEAGRPTPFGYFPTLQSAVSVLLGWLSTDGDVVVRPASVLPSPKDLDECRRAESALPPAALHALEGLLAARVRM